ncbi:tRNA 2'-phosphotransferase 1-like isoform X2 [Cylas formicarius]|uniref:tRNA 2'-phosphotransferase 1-like isoform X2 n=1 Tax=Cylas formicarius TaxID=197179 RepID=UPI002958DF1B|nr:tRNA 2'-phosphotransferase 1-like isoform X2 [Cylas formicarius]
MQIENDMSESSRDTSLSKALSWILRHKAVEKNIKINEEGFIRVQDFLSHKKFRGKYNIDDIKRVVATNDKQRFTLRTYNGILEICADQGHSLNFIRASHLTPITSPQTIQVLHGTYIQNWKFIRIQGLSRMRRNHIHFAKGLPGDKQILSGMRRNCQIVIYINLELALRDGLKFYLSLNNVILSPGNEEGIIAPKYFLKVCDLSGNILQN